MTWQPLAVDLFCGLGGWTEGLLAEGYRVVGFDLERHHYGEAKYPAQLVLQDVLTIHGRQFKDAALIVASPPCQEFSYMAMPWSRAKQIEAEYLDGTRDVKQLTALFDACFRIQREAIEAAGHHIPLVVENVRGAQKWVGRSRYHFGSFHLWGDVLALMPMVKTRHAKLPGNNGPRMWVDREIKRLCDAPIEGMKNTGGSWFNIGSPGQKEVGRNPVHREISAAWRAKHYDQTDKMHTSRDCGIEREGLKQGGDWFNKASGKSISRRCSSRSVARKAASAHIAKIPFVLASWVARAHKPMEAIA